MIIARRQAACLNREDEGTDRHCLQAGSEHAMPLSGTG